MTVGSATKDPSSTLDYKFDWTQWLVAGDSLAQLIPPPILSATPSPAGGTLAGGLYYYVATFANALGLETNGSQQVLVSTSGSASSVFLSWENSGANSTHIYRAVAPEYAPIIGGYATAGTYTYAIPSQLPPGALIDIIVLGGGGGGTLIPPGQGLIAQLLTDFEELIGLHDYDWGGYGGQWTAVTLQWGGTAGSYPVIPNTTTSLTVTVGAGGTGANGAPGSAGSASSVSGTGFTTITANGGAGAVQGGLRQGGSPGNELFNGVTYSGGSTQTALGPGNGPGGGGYGPDAAGASGAVWIAAYAPGNLLGPTDWSLIGSGSPGANSFTDTGTTGTPQSPPVTNSAIGAQFSATNGLTIASWPEPSVTETTATVWVTGGTAGNAYELQCEVVTAEGRVDSRSATISVVDL